jgi:hypothetical protein
VLSVVTDHETWVCPRVEHPAPEASFAAFAGQERKTMTKDRLEWVLSGLSRYKLTSGEEQFLKSAENDFRQKDMLTDKQEERLENLYREKSRLAPNKNVPLPPESKSPGKAKFKRLVRVKTMP